MMRRWLLLSLLLSTGHAHAYAQAYAVTLSLTSLMKTVSARERPSITMCDADPDYSEDCEQYPGPRSFFSGHASTTATGAGLLCAHHTHLPLYGGGVFDVGACAAGVALTILTGVFRVSADRHWASDVVAGHLFGFASGYFIPTLLYYTEPLREAPATAFVPHVTREELGVRLLGRM